MKKNRVVWIVVLFIILYLSAIVNYLNSGNGNFNINYIWLAFIDFAISSFVMMIIPFVFRIVNKKKLSLKKGKIICACNSIILFIVSCILMEIFNIGFIGGLGAIMFYFINKWTFVNLNE